MGSSIVAFIVGIGVVVFSGLSAVALYTESNTLITVGEVVMIVAIIVGLAVSFWAMIKYIKGIL